MGYLVSLLCRLLSFQQVAEAAYTSSPVAAAAACGDGNVNPISQTARLSTAHIRSPLAADDCDLH